jgi:hypothetical protein
MLKYFLKLEKYDHLFFLRKNKSTTSIHPPKKKPASATLKGFLLTNAVPATLRE